MAQFSTGLGHDKVFSGEYELFNSVDSETVLSRDNFTNVGLVPGMSITMAIIIGQYGELGRCPRTDCKSRSFIDGPMGGKSWYVLQLATVSRSSSPSPFLSWVSVGITLVYNRSFDGMTANTCVAPHAMHGFGLPEKIFHAQLNRQT
jgi:hypothetical protein